MSNHLAANCLVSVFSLRGEGDTLAAGMQEKDDPAPATSTDIPEEMSPSGKAGPQWDKRPSMRQSDIGELKKRHENMMRIMCM